MGEALFGEWMREGMRKLDLSEEALAKKAKYSVNYVRNLANSKTPPNEKAVGVIAKALGIEEIPTFSIPRREAHSLERSFGDYISKVQSSLDRKQFSESIQPIFDSILDLGFMLRRVTYQPDLARMAYKFAEELCVGQDMELPRAIAQYCVGRSSHHVGTGVPERELEGNALSVKKRIEEHLMAIRSFTEAEPVLRKVCSRTTVTRNWWDSDSFDKMMAESSEGRLSDLEVSQIYAKLLTSVSRSLNSLLRLGEDENAKDLVVPLFAQELTGILYSEEDYESFLQDPSKLFGSGYEGKPVNLPIWIDSWALLEVASRIRKVLLKNSKAETFAQIKQHASIQVDHAISERGKRFITSSAYDCQSLLSGLHHTVESLCSLLRNDGLTEMERNSATGSLIFVHRELGYQHQICHQYELSIWHNSLARLLINNETSSESKYLEHHLGLDSKHVGNSSLVWKKLRFIDPFKFEKQIWKPTE